MRLVPCSKSQWHRFHAEGEACPECEPEPARDFMTEIRAMWVDNPVPPDYGSGLAAWLPSGMAARTHDLQYVSRELAEHRRRVAIASGFLRAGHISREQFKELTGLDLDCEDET